MSSAFCVLLAAFLMSKCPSTDAMLAWAMPRTNVSFFSRNAFRDLPRDPGVLDAGCDGVANPLAA